MAAQKEHWLANALDWGMRAHWLWTVFPATWKAAIWALALAGIAAILAWTNKITAVHWWIFSLTAAAIYVIVWVIVQRFAPAEFEVKSSSLLKRARSLIKKLSY